ncbi:MAG: formylglycine-generating enzyme family protein [bacterium]|nr:formylglycine-generating enzyme family protein [bacterium]
MSIVRIKIAEGCLLQMVGVPGGSFKMGSNAHESEYPIHKVTIAPFLIGRYTITQFQWHMLMGYRVFWYVGAERPADCVSWDDSVGFCDRLSEVTNLPFRLLSESEWEYACRAGTTATDLIFGAGTLGPYSTPTDLAEQHAWCKSNSGSVTHPVGQLRPNVWSVYDMLGNVWEWCSDTYVSNYLKAPYNGNPVIVKGSSLRVLRGGSLRTNPRNIRCTSRAYDGQANDPSYVGFRVALQTLIKE